MTLRAGLSFIAERFKDAVAMYGGVLSPEQTGHIASIVEEVPRLNRADDFKLARGSWAPPDPQDVLTQALALIEASTNS